MLQPVILSTDHRKMLQKKIDEQHHLNEGLFEEMCLTVDDLSHLVDEVRRYNIKWKRLNLWKNGFGPHGNVYLEQILKILPLTSLHLGLNHLGPQGITSLKVLCGNQTLTELDLWDNSIGDDGIRTLAQVFPYTKLQILNLGVNLIGDSGCQVLVHALPPMLTHLNLYANKMSITSHDAIIILLNSQRPKLVELNLEATTISSTGSSSCKDEIRKAAHSNHCTVLI
jgi:Ran GTPase-activating protein (RanGAP) involved in mRNA processing and transport